MKTMLYADWMNLKQLFKSLLFVCAVFVLAAFLWNGPTFFCMLTVMISIMIPNSLCVADRSYGWDKLSLSLPVTRRDAVGSKFVMCGLVNAAVLGIMAVLAVIYCLLHPEEPLAENLTALLVCEAAAFLLMGVNLCAIYRWGVEKARYILMACIWIPLIGIFLMRRLDISMPDLSWLDNLGEMRLAGLTAALAVIGLAVYLLCCCISVRIYRKTEL